MGRNPGAARDRQGREHGLTYAGSSLTTETNSRSDRQEHSDDADGDPIASAERPIWRGLQPELQPLRSRGGSACHALPGHGSGLTIQREGGRRTAVDRVENELHPY